MKKITNVQIKNLSMKEAMRVRQILTTRINKLAIDIALSLPKELGSRYGNYGAVPNIIWNGEGYITVMDSIPASQLDGAGREKTLVEGRKKIAPIIKEWKKFGVVLKATSFQCNSPTKLSLVAHFKLK